MEKNKQVSVAYTADVIDPFVLCQQLSTLQWIKVAVLSVTLLPVRLLLMSAVLLLTWLLGTAMLLGIPAPQARGVEPLSGWRRRYAKPLITRMARLVFYVGGWRWSVVGRRADRKEAPLLLVGPHSSFLDTAAVIALDCPGMVVKDSTARAPLFGSLIRYQQPLLVRSEDRESRHRAAEEIRRRTTSTLGFEQVLIFPEGGCGNRKALLHFKLGGFAPGVPVQPVIIRYKNDLDTLTWTWDGPGALRQVWLTLTQFRIKGELEFLPVYHPSEYEQEHPRYFADNVQSYMSKWSGTPISRFTVEDARFLLLSRKRGLPTSVAIAKLIRLRRDIGRHDMDPAEEFENLREKNNNNVRMRGDVIAMAAYIGLGKCPEALKDFYALMDQHGEESLDVRIYAAGLCLIRADLKAKEKIKAAFQAFGTGNEADHLAAILLMWKGVPTSRSTFQILTYCESTEKEDSSN